MKHSIIDLYISFSKASFANSLTPVTFSFMKDQVQRLEDLLESKEIEFSKLIKIASQDLSQMDDEEVSKMIEQEKNNNSK